MSVEQNKAIVREYFECMINRDVERLEPFLADNFHWIVPVRGKALAHLAFPRDRETTIDRIKTIFSGMSKNPEFKILTITGEDERVHVESDGLMFWKTGQVMDNQFHHAFVFKDGKIEKITEYCDFLAIWEADPMAAEEHVKQPDSVA